MKEIIIDDKKYLLIRNENGTHSLKTYNEKYKMWITVNFQKEANKEVEEELIRLLSMEYLEKVKTP